MTSVFYPAAPYDRLVIAVTLMVWVLLGGLTLLFVYLVRFYPPSSYLVGVVAMVFMVVMSVVVLLGTYLFSPRGYRLTARELVIVRPFRSIVIPYDDIAEANRQEWIWKGVRLWGGGGLYGYIGLFHISGLGRIWMYVTNKNKLVLIKTKNSKQYAISPDKLDLLDKLKNNLRQRS